MSNNCKLIDINLKDAKYYFLTTGTRQDRRDNMMNNFKNHDITEINPDMTVPKFQSGAIGFSRMIDLGLRNQDRTKPFQPFVIMEDDIDFFC